MESGGGIHRGDVERQMGWGRRRGVSGKDVERREGLYEFDESSKERRRC